VLAVAVVATAAGALAHAGDARLARDIERTSTGCVVSKPVQGHDAVYFGTWPTCLGGVALWRSDGTALGTRPVMMLEAVAGAPRRVAPLPFLGGATFFALSGEGSSGGALNELWRTDGSETGTALVRVLESGHEILHSGDADSASASLGGKLLFFVRDEAHDVSLWASDGTSDGTRELRVLDVEPPVRFIARDDVLLFVARRGSGYALFRTDGTAEGTEHVHELGVPEPAPYGQPPEVALDGDSTIWFEVTVTGAQRELWRSDGSAETTRLVASLPPGAAWTLVDGVHFVLEARRALARIWRLDPAGGALTLLHDFAPPAPGSNDLRVRARHVGVLYLTYTDNAGRSRFWRSDGTPAGTFELYPGFVHDPVVALAGGVAFRPEVDGAPDGLWHTDGTIPGTRPILAESPRFGPDLLASLGDVSLLVVESETSADLHRTDGTPEGTWALQRRLAALPRSIVVRSGVASFFSDSTLWRSDGTHEGTFALVELGTKTLGSEPASLTEVGGSLLFTVARPVGDANELWKSEGTRDGTTLVADFPDGDDALGLLTPVGDRLLFARGASEVWASDGTAAGTRLVASRDLIGAGRAVTAIHDHAGTAFVAVRGRGADGALLRVAEGTDSAQLVAPVAPTGFASLGATLFLAGAAAPEAAALWRSDGTASGTEAVVTFGAVNERRRPEIGALFAGAGALYFSVARLGRTSLWRSDGTAQGTSRVATLPRAAKPAAAKRAVREGAWLGDVLVFFFPSDVAGGPNLWRSDGTEAGTGPVAAVPPFFDLAEFTVAGEHLYFVSPRGDTVASHLSDLWVSDGTEAGTRLLLDGHVVRGTLLPVDDLLYFCGGTVGEQPRVWRSDGTPAGTVPAFSARLRCSDVERAGERLFVAAFTPRYGSELWSALLGP
jgi:ELWxxDGT repeat protein